MTVQDIARADAIYGPQVPMLRGKKVRQALNEFTSMPRVFVPSEILKHHPTDEIDLDFETTGAIALRSSNNSRGYYFQSLSTGRRVHVLGKAAWTELPIPDHVITRFEELTDAEGQPIMNDKVPLFEWSPGVPLVDDDDDQAANRCGDGTTEEN